MIAPMFFKQNKQNIFKYVKYFALLCILVVVGVFTYKLYGAVTGTMASMVNNRVLIEKQSTMIEQQIGEIKSMEEQIKQLNESHEKTKDILNELSKEKEKLQKKEMINKKTIETTIKNIEKQDLPQAEKDNLKSIVLIENLNNTYCELFPINCKSI
jgi:septal ring factor EnvC (AmiA/AmiB activator)